MIRVGLTGSIATGKSEVARVLAEAGVPVFDADKAVHDLYNSQEGFDLLRPVLPHVISNERVDRAKLAAHIEKHPEDLGDLETLVHAKVAERREDFASVMKRAGYDLIVFDIPLLLEKGDQKQVDVVIVVSASEEQQRRRALARQGMTQERLKVILSRQMPDAEKRKLADYIIDNTGDLSHLRQQTLAVLAAIRKARGS